MEETPLMDPVMYQNLISRTAVYPKQFGIGYTFVGLLEEMEELRDKLFSLNKGSITEYESIKEVGDCFWYVVACMTELNMLDDFADIFEKSSLKRNSKLSVKDLVKAVDMLDGYILDFGIDRLISNSGSFKKYMRDGRFIREEFIELFSDIVDFLNFISESLGYHPKQVLHINFDKLMKRRETNTLHGEGDDREININN